MECCVCLDELNEVTSVIFSMSKYCSPKHLLCIRCYLQVDQCPLCRFSPYITPDQDGERLLLRYRNQKNINQDKIMYLKTQLNLIFK
jgi:hypothetical protein